MLTPFVCNCMIYQIKIDRWSQLRNERNTYNNYFSRYYLDGFFFYPLTSYVKLRYTKSHQNKTFSSFGRRKYQLELSPQKFTSQRMALVTSRSITLVKFVKEQDKITSGMKVEICACATDKLGENISFAGWFSAKVAHISLEFYGSDLIAQLIEKGKKDFPWKKVLTI